MTFFDLTQPFLDNMPVYPGDARTRLTCVSNVPTHGFTNHHVSTGMHVGTHMDAPLHMVENGSYLDDISVEKFFGRGVILDATNKPLIEESLLDGVHLRRGDIVLFYTGHSSLFWQAEYYSSYPAFSIEIARRLAEADVSIVGMDSPSPDYAPFPVHKILLSAGILLLENLTNLAPLLAVPYFEVIALPSKFRADGAPARVIARALPGPAGT